jgi:predicted aconitase with swiveling domain
MIDSSSEPVVASTIDCAVPAGNTMTIVSGSVPCSIVSFWGEVDARGGAVGDAMGFVEGCAAASAGADVVCCELIGTASSAGVSGMLMKRT